VSKSTIRYRTWKQMRAEEGDAVTDEEIEYQAAVRALRLALDKVVGRPMTDEEWDRFRKSVGGLERDIRRSDNEK